MIGDGSHPYASGRELLALGIGNSESK